MTHPRNWIRTLSTFAVLAALAVAARAADPLWQELAAGSFELDEEALAELLADAPLEFTEAAGDPRWEITLPTPEGALARFRFVESPIMAPELAAQFPEIRTYRGWGIDDPSATTRFVTASGRFHAMVHSSEGTFSIDPLPGDDTPTYASSSWNDAGGESVACSVDDGDSAKAGGPGPGAAFRSAPGDDRLALHSANASGTTLRTLRLAAAATAEYTNAFGSPAAAAAEIFRVLSDVNLVYERELAVRLTVVAAVIWPAHTQYSDPYESSDQSEVWEENQETLDRWIGVGNYDLGHLFDTRFDGGRAWLGSACDDEHKGKGMSSFPTGFDHVMVVHELGHQLGANHTFNDDCGGGGQRNDDTAYEPGCGRTWMSYGGATERIDYFHGTSLRAMADHLDNFSGCGTATSSNNTPPQVSASLPVPPPNPSNPLNVLAVPVQTPFALTASGSDADMDPVTYSWETTNNGSPGPWDADRGFNPLFESQVPTADPTASFPPLRLLGNSPPPLMATLPRWFSFLVTARDDRGGFAQDSVFFAATDESGPFVVTAPAAGTEVVGGQPITVTWDVAGTDSGLVNTQVVRILFSTDDGNTFPTELAASTPNDGSFTFTPPCLPTRLARIKVEAVGNIFFSVSPSFIILGPTISPIPINSSQIPFPALFVTQGGPGVAGPVATVTDPQEAAGLLAVRPLSAPNGLSVILDNDAGEVRATASAQCSLPTGSLHRVEWEVENSAGCRNSAIFFVSVAEDPPPTLGSYPDVTVRGGESVTVSPSPPPADPNDNLSEVDVWTVWTATPPLSAGLSASTVSGEVTIDTDGSTRPGAYAMRVRARDSCGETSPTRSFVLTVENTPPQIVGNSNLVRTTPGGPPSALVAVATVSDLQDAAGALHVAATAPAELTVEVEHVEGTVWASAAASCAAALDSHDVTVTVTDSGLATAETTFPVIVDPNPAPTLGTYFDSAVTAGASVLNVPSAPPSDPNNSAVAVAVSVNPMFLPGGGQVIPFADGSVRVVTVGTTTPSTYQIVVTGRDACNAETTRSFRVRVRDATCVAEQSVVFAADTGNHRIQRFNGSSWNVIGLGTPGSGLGQFTSPEAVVATASGQTLYVADTGNSRIQWSHNGGATWAVFASGLIPQGLVLDRDGHLYVSDLRDNRVVRYAGGVPGSPIVLAGSGSGAGQVRNPHGLAIDCRMNLYVADTGNNRILAIATADVTMVPNTGTVVAGSGAGLNPAQVTAPQGVAVDSAGRLFVADTGNHRVLTMASAPAPGAATALCTLGGALGQVRGPEGVTITAFTSGPLAGVPSVVVSDTTNDRVQARALPAGPWMLLGGPAQLKKPSKVR